VRRYQQHFAVHADGKSFHISQPEFAALTGPGQTLIILHKHDNGFDLVVVSLIARVEGHDPRRKPKSRCFRASDWGQTRP